MFTRRSASVKMWVCRKRNEAFKIRPYIYIGFGYRNRILAKMTMYSVYNVIMPAILN